MTEKKQITIYDLLPLLRKGWLAMDKHGKWSWHESKPRIDEKYEIWAFNKNGYLCTISKIFNIKPFDGNWKDSLMEIK